MDYLVSQFLKVMMYFIISEHKDEELSMKDISIVLQFWFRPFSTNAYTLYKLWVYRSPENETCI